MHTSRSRVFIAVSALLALTFWGAPASAQEIDHGGMLELESVHLDSEGGEDCSENEAEQQSLIESVALEVESEIEGSEQAFALCAGSESARISESLESPVLSVDERAPILDVSEGGLPRGPLMSLRSGTLMPLPSQPLQGLPSTPSATSRVGTWGGLASFVVVTAMEVRHPDSTQLPANLELSARRASQYLSATPARTTVMTSMEPVAVRWHGL